ncbi:MAG: LacI family transcriptional regulator [Actinomycetota bacterium]|nr:LacI family transcriptional regulator [Actinomycetota bacterium]
MEEEREGAVAAGVGEWSTVPSRRPARLRLADVAALAETSVATASLALNGKAVGEQTRTRVLEAARRLRYVPEASARALKTGRTAVIGMIIVNRPQTVELTGSSSFFYAVLRGALVAGELEGFHISWHVITADLTVEERQLSDLAASGRYDAMVIFPQWVNDARYAVTIARLGVPAITVNDPHAVAPTLPMAAVVLDNDQAMALSLEHLLDAGHRRIAYLAGPAEHLEADRRLDAYRSLMAGHGVVVPDSYVHRVEYTIEDGATGFDVLWDQIRVAGDAAPTAMLAASDYVAAGLMQAAQRRGVVIPDDLSVVGFDDLDVARATTPRLTTIAQPLTRLGEIVTLAAIGLLRGDLVGTTVLPTRLVERESVTTFTGPRPATKP